MGEAEVMCLLCFVRQIARVHNGVIGLPNTYETMFNVHTSALTFMTTCMSASARTLGANSEPRNASRLYRV